MKVHELLEAQRLPSNLGLSPKALKELRSWRQSKTSGKYGFTPDVVEELIANDKLKRPKPIRVYRGLNFDEKIIAKNKDLLKMVEQWKTGTVEVTWPKPSSWSTSRAIATMFAKHGTSKVGREDRVHSGLHGVLVSMVVDPSDVLMDFTLFDFTTEDEVVVNKGTFTCKVEKHYEGNEETSHDKEEDLQELLATITKELKEFKARGQTIQRNPLQFLYVLEKIRNDARSMDLTIAEAHKKDPRIAYLINARKMKLQDPIPRWENFPNQSDAKNPEQLDKMMKVAMDVFL